MQTTKCLITCLLGLQVCTVYGKYISAVFICTIPEKYFFGGGEEEKNPEKQTNKHFSDASVDRSLFLVLSQLVL